MTDPFDIEEEGEAYRSEVLSALEGLGLTPARLATEMKALLEQNDDLTVKSRAVDRILELKAAVPKRASRVRIDATSRQVRLTLGAGALGGIDPSKLKTLAPAERQQAVALLARLREDETTESETEE